METNINILLGQLTQNEDNRNIYKKCIQCNKRRKPLDESHKICGICNKLKLLYKPSGNIFVDDFIKNTQINGDLMVFVPYDRFKDIEFVFEVGFSKIYIANWIDGWNEKEILKWSGPKKVVLKQLNNSENITSKELNEVHIS